MDKGVMENELYERMVQKLMLAVVKFRLTKKKYKLSEGSTGRTFKGECPFTLYGGVVG